MSLSQGFYTWLTDILALSWGLSWALGMGSGIPDLDPLDASSFPAPSHGDPAGPRSLPSVPLGADHPQVKPLLSGQLRGSLCPRMVRGPSWGAHDTWTPSAWKPLPGRPGTRGRGCGLKSGSATRSRETRATRSLPLRLTGHTRDSGRDSGDSTPSGAPLKFKRPLTVTREDAFVKV